MRWIGAATLVACVQNRTADVEAIFSGEAGVRISVGNPNDVGFGGGIVHGIPS